MAARYLAIHGHFYQPPRENPWLGQVKLEPSAAPFHDWNQRVTRECYAPNTAARLMSPQGEITGLVNNYAHMSFNFGPTLLAWLENRAPRVYRGILEADRLSRELYGGAGGAMAQVYNHLIMPLASRRDKLLQIRWGLADFASRFKREAEGMWLAETAVDDETLDCLAECGVKFTVLAPGQCAAVRPLGDPAAPWQDARNEKVDTTRPYLARTRGGRQIAIFFYQGPLSRAVAYERLLSSGDGLLKAIEEAFPAAGHAEALLSLATDGESYGHHFKFGDMALAWMIESLKNREDLKLTNYAAYLAAHPPRYLARVLDNSSWSCAHGVERWRDHCGCSVGHNPGWSQAWRKPLRQGFDELKKSLDQLWEQRAGEFFPQPDQALQDAWPLAFAHDPGRADEFLAAAGAGQLAPEDRQRALALVHGQIMAAFMFTSCGWFFDDISGLEPRQVMMYAARAMDLAAFLGLGGLEERLMRHLARARSNLARWEDGAKVWNDRVATARYHGAHLAAHQALALLAGCRDKVAPVVLDHQALALSQQPDSLLLAAVSLYQAGSGRTRHFCCLAGWEGQGRPFCLAAQFGLPPDLSLEAAELARAGNDPVAAFQARHGRVTRISPADLSLDALFDLGRLLALSAEEQTRAALCQGPAGRLLPFLAGAQASWLYLEDQVFAPAVAAALADDADEAVFRGLAQAARGRVHPDHQDRSPLLKRAAEAWLDRNGQALAGPGGAQRLPALLAGLALCNQTGINPDLWNTQNLVIELEGERAYQDSLDGEQKQLWRELKKALHIAA